MDNQQKSNSKAVSNDWNVAGIVIRLIASAVVLAITAFLTPGFAITGIGPLIVAAIVFYVSLLFIVSLYFVSRKGKE